MTISEVTNDIDEMLLEDIPSEKLVNQIGVPKALPKYFISPYKEDRRNKPESAIFSIKFFSIAFVGLVLIWFGLTTTGTYFEPSSRFSGFLATLWYGYQLGTFLAIFGALTFYESLKRLGYL